MFYRPKTHSGEDRIVDLDAGTLGTLAAHRFAQDVERQQWGEAYSEHGLVFAREDGSPMDPPAVTRRFKELEAEIGARHVKVHGLRHGQASLMLAAGVDIALVSKRLGHSTIAVTADTYSHLLEGVGREAAERAAALVPRKRRDQSVTTQAESEADRLEVDR
jgi:integrase